MDSSVPAIGRPSGVSPHACWAKRLCTTSSGSSSCMAISSRMTSRSASTSSGASVELVIMSPRTSTASGRSWSRTRAWKQVYSLAVKALNSPPTASSCTEMSSAERSAVPLKSRCSRKCEQPSNAADSSREPTPTHTPMLAERTPASCSLITRSPPGSTVRRTREVTWPSGPVSVCSVRVVPIFWAEADDRPAVARRPVVVLPEVTGTSLLLGVPGVVGGGSLGLVHDRDEGELAAVVDLGDLDLDLLAHRDDVLDGVDAPAAGEGAELADVQQAVLAGEQRDERTEVRRLDHGAEVALADLGHRRVGDRVDGLAGRLGGLAVGCTDVDGAVVLDGQRRARVVLDLVDHLALGADDLADLVDGDAQRDDARRVHRHLLGLVDGLGHHVEDRQAGVARLGQRRREDLGGDAVELGVELEGGDELA